MSNLKLILLSIIIFISTSCASYYRATKPETINYPSAIKTNENLEFSYRYDILRDAGNKKYVNSERRKNIKLVAIKLTNNTEMTINLKDNVSFYCGDSKVLLLNSKEIHSKIKQAWPVYGLYLIGAISLAPLDILVFGGIGAGNMIVANSANKKMMNEMSTYDITDKELKKGETIIGIIGFEALHADPISVKIN